MKANKFLFGLFTAATLLVVGCAADDTADVTIIIDGGTNPTNPSGDEIGGTLTSDLTLSTGTEYNLT
ncbi:MAG: hypothetical protein HRU26_07930, partial [Psychroserpens sp.]|nr:hypothetical protein [Psychroserpens sp.]